MWGKWSSAKTSFVSPAKYCKKNLKRPRFHLHENSLIHHENARETGTRIIAAKLSLKDLIFCRYVRERNIVDKWCFEVHFVAGEKEKFIGLWILKIITVAMNKAMDILQKTSPKYAFYIDNKVINILVFEGFDVHSYQFIHQNQDTIMTNFLMLNSIFFWKKHPFDAKTQWSPLVFRPWY